MRKPSFLLSVLAVAATAVNSYTIDPDLEDGVYYIAILPNSTHKAATYGEPIRLDVPETWGNMSEQHVVGKVPVPTTSGSCFDAIEHQEDLEGAKKILSDICDSGKKIPARERRNGGMLISRYGSSVAWACSQAEKQGCAPNEIDDAWAQIAKRCKGVNKGGEVCMSKWSKCYGHCTSKGLICENVV